MAVLTVAAKEGRKTADLDIGSAYLEAEWKGDPVHIVIEKMLATIYTHEFPELKKFQQEDGTMLMRLDKALYGTLIAGRLWFNKLTTVLTEMGFAPNPLLDPCVLNQTRGGKQLTVVIFVDDILATCEDESSLSWLIEELKNKFAEVKGCVRDDFSYLGMHVHNNHKERVVEVSMEGYEDELSRYADVTGVRATPAAANLFEPGTTAPLSPRDLSHFHTMVAKLLYLSCRTRPQIATAVSYLTTRVTCANEGDQHKLDRVLMYINGTRGNKLYLRGDQPWGVRAYVDVGFGSHEDGKSHTGVLHKLCGSTVSAKSKKQKMVSKDSTEGELVGLTDRVDGVLRLDEFMRYQGHDMETPVIYQDNQSTITLVTKGGGKYRNVHLRVRQCRLKEMIESGRVKVIYLCTGSMIADLLTKPLQGMLFVALENKLLDAK